ncbi:MAG TPA: hypothetical protein VK619_15770 [Pyrinomonadaceae bacterium]|nr:hypothetical protein [Pyrinomonadaceae bacterium]
MKLRLFPFALLLNLLFALPVAAQSLDDVFIKGDMLDYQGYEATRHFNPRTRYSTATIKKGRRVLAILRNGWFLEDSTRIGLFSFLGGDNKQLIVEQYTGGAHCCWIYKIYNLSTDFRLLFDGTRYGIDEVGYELNLVDIDHDGRYEFTQSEMAFDYFHMSHAVSRFPTVVFAYDERAREYRPANARFAEYVLRGIEQDIEEVKKLNGQTLPADESFVREKIFSAVIQVLLKYIYSGRETEGWSFYDRNYKLSDREQMRAEIKKQLKSSIIYNSIYRRGNHRGSR